MARFSAKKEKIFVNEKVFALDLYMEPGLRPGEAALEATQWEIVVEAV